MKGDALPNSADGFCKSSESEAREAGDPRMVPAQSSVANAPNTIAPLSKRSSKIHGDVQLLDTRKRENNETIIVNI